MAPSCRGWSSSACSVAHTRPTAQRLRDSALWHRLERVVLEVPAAAVDDQAPAPAGQAGPRVDVLPAEMYTHRDSLIPTVDAAAFIALRERVDAAQLVLACEVGHAEHLAATVATTAWPLPELTVIRLRGAGASELLPFGIASALQRRTGAPVVSFAMSRAGPVAYGVVLHGDHYRRSEKDLGPAGRRAAAT